jgi:hypothetical protein
LAVNLAPLAGALLFRWSVYPLLLLYWVENVIVGCYTALRFPFASGDAMAGWGTKLFYFLFFLAHYGGFATVHGVFVWVLFRTPGGAETAGPEFRWVVAALALSHGFSFVWNYLLGGEHRRARLADLMLQPYKRVVVLHVVIIFGGMLVMGLGSPMAGLVALVIVKTGMDWRAHEREHDWWPVAA